MSKRMKILIFVVLAICCTVVFLIEKNDKLAYTPRDLSVITSSELGIDGALKWIAQRKGNPINGRVELYDIVKAEQQLQDLKRKRSGGLNLDWEEVGPDNVGGRTRAILIDKDNSDVMYAGGVSGGLWKSINAGKSWKMVTNGVGNLAIVSICQASNGDIYVGTGETDLMFFKYRNIFGLNGTSISSVGMFGNGIWKSTDSGNSFNLLSSTNYLVDSSFMAVSRLAAHPTDENQIFASTAKGLMLSFDAGSSWQNVTGLNTFSRDVKYGVDGTVYASVTEEILTDTTIYYGDSIFQYEYDVKCYVLAAGTNVFKQVSNDSEANMLPIEGVSRIEIATAPGNSDYVYCQVYKDYGTAIYESSDKGQSWALLNYWPNYSVDNPLGDQGEYDNTIAVFPNNERKIIFGGQSSIWIGENKGNGWAFTPQTDWWLGYDNSRFVHADQHAIVFNPTDPDKVYIGTDGGIFYSTDGGEGYKSMNINYNVTQFYSVAMSSDDVVLGGTQDNGTLYLDPNSNKVSSDKGGQTVTGGDGGKCEISVLDNEIMFSTVYYGETYRCWDNAGKLETPEKIYPTDDDVNPNSNDASFITPITLWESYCDLNSPDSVYYIAEESYDIGEEIGVQSATGKISFIHELTDQVEVGDTVKVQDVIQSKLYLGLNKEIKVMFNPLFSGNKTWHSLVSVVNMRDLAGNIEIIECSKDGNYMYFTDYVLLPHKATSNIYKASNLSKVRSYTMETKDTTITLKTSYTKWENIDSTLVDSSLVYDEDNDIYYYGNYEYDYDTLWGVDTIYAVADVVRTITTTDSVEVMKIGEFEDQIITDITVDPNDAGSILVTTGNYNSDTHIWYATNADSTISESGNFVSKQGDLPVMPAYTAIIDCQDSLKVIVGTELGIFSTSNISASSVSWVEELAEEMGRVPVYMLRQQIHENGWNKLAGVHTGVVNHGYVYAATHGRGIFKTSSLKGPVSVPEQPLAKSDIGTLSIYPNPSSTELHVQIEGDGEYLQIYSISGELMEQVMVEQGVVETTLDISRLSKGIYVVKLLGQSQIATQKIIIQ